MAYLCIGDDMDRLESTNIYVYSFKGVKYFEVDLQKVIKGESVIFCSCNENYCWHIFKVLFDEKKAL